MIISESNGGGELPPKKPQNVVCVGVIDVGESYGIEPNTDPKLGPVGARLVPAHPKAENQEPKQKIRFIFESEALTEDGRPFRLTDQFNCTLHKESKLKPFLDSWGVELVKTDSGYDMEASCVGKCALVNVTHDERGERTWANISSIMPSAENVKPSGEFNKAEYLKKCQENYAERSQ